MKFAFLKKTTCVPLKGFTLIEALVSAFVITSVVLGPLTVALDATSYARLTKDSMIATYLAEEAVELLRQQQDSLYIRCTQESGTDCVLQNAETPSEAAWRLFRERLSFTNGGVSCYVSDNPSGCSYDFLDMSSDIDQPPIKYLSNATFCGNLSLREADSLYVCAGVRDIGGTGDRRFTRSIQIQSLQTFSGPDADYNDDLRVISTVTFRRPSGFSREIKFVDFLHSRS